MVVNPLILFELRVCWLASKAERSVQPAIACLRLSATGTSC